MGLEQADEALDGLNHPAKRIERLCRQRGCGPQGPLSKHQPDGGEHRLLQIKAILTECYDMIFETAWILNGFHTQAAQPLSHSPPLWLLNSARFAIAKRNIERWRRRQS
jgi:hypothetical protein